MLKEDVLKKLTDCGLVAVVRANNAEEAIKISDACLAGGCTGIELTFTVLYWGRPYAEHSVLDTPLCSLFAWIAVIAALAFMKKWGDISNTLTRWMAAKSWGLYLFHYLFIAMTAYYLNMYTKLPAALLYLFVAAAGTWEPEPFMC